jgi:hypothetical protein
MPPNIRCEHCLAKPWRLAELAPAPKEVEYSA